MKRKLIFLSLLTLTLSACGATNVDNDVPATGIPTKTIQPTAIPSKTASPSPTATLSPTSTSSPTATPTITNTPLPTLEAEEALKFVMELYDTNAGCLFPCWWGIVPGQTEWRTAKEFLASFALSVGRNYATFQVPYDVNRSESVDILFQYNEDGIVELIHSANPWRIKPPMEFINDLLTIYGPPTEIYFRAIADSPPPPFFYYVLFYPDIGLMFMNSGEGERNGESLTLCPYKEYHLTSTPQIWLWDPVEVKTFEEVAEGFIIGVSPAVEHPYFNLEEVTNIDVELFYQTYLDVNSKVCFETPADIWP